MVSKNTRARSLASRPNDSWEQGLRTEGRRTKPPLQTPTFVREAIPARTGYRCGFRQDARRHFGVEGCAFGEGVSILFSNACDRPGLGQSRPRMCHGTEETCCTTVAHRLDRNLGTQFRRWNLRLEVSGIGESKWGYDLDVRTA